VLCSSSSPSSIIPDFSLSFIPCLLWFHRHCIRSVHLHSTSPTLRMTFLTFPILHVSSRYIVHRSRLSHIVPPIVKSRRAIVGPFLSLHIFIIDYLTYNTLHRSYQFLSFGCWFVLVSCLWNPFRLFVSCSDIQIIFWCSPVSPHISGMMGSIDMGTMYRSQGRWWGQLSCCWWHWWQWVQLPD
jgi:hypothetical protein